MRSWALAISLLAALKHTWALKMALQFPQINWNMLSQMGDSVAELGPMYRERQLRNEMAGLIGPDGKISDWDKASALVTKHNPIAGLKLAQDSSNSDSALDWLKFKSEDDHRKALTAARDKPSPTDRKAMRDAKLDVARTNQALATLREAYGLIGEKGDGIYDQYGAGLQADIGTKIPGVSEWLGKKGYVDRDKAMRTQKFRQLMGPEALKYLSAVLKGPTSEKEMAKFMELYADPSTPNAVKASMLNTLIKASEADLGVQQGIVNEDAAGPVGGSESLAEGAEVDGYRYLGGDPNDQGSWEAIQ
jgi:hypothetical protein